MPRLLRHLVLLGILAAPLAAQSAPADSAASRPRRSLVRWPEALGFVAVAGVTFANDRAISREVGGHRSGFGNAVADFGNGIGDGVIIYPALALGMAAGKLSGSRGTFGVSWRAFQTTALAGLSVMVLKTAIGRQRPWQSPDDAYVFHPFQFKDNSLPSGHTAVSFALAASLAAETRDHWSDAAFFGLATLTAFGRMHYDKHWASDTVLGAGIGILSARIIHRNRLPVVVTPGGVGMAVSF